MRPALAITLAIVASASGASAQAVIVAPAPPCPPGVPCLVPSAGVTVSGGASIGVSNPTAGGARVVEPPPAPPGPVAPAPGTFALAYLGAYDATDVLGGAGLRFTGHLTDVWFLEATFGALGRSGLIEAPFLIGVRVMAPIEAPIVRAYGVLATGILVRAVTGIDPGYAWGNVGFELGGGLEVGGPIDERFSIGAFVDVRATARLPFERETSSIGVGWSAGVAFLWF